jgi:hypothetical protein
MDKTIRENLDGKYLFVYTNEFIEAIGFALENKLEQIQIRYGSSGKDDNVVDFNEIERISPYLKIISFCNLDAIKIMNFERIYSLKKLEKIYINPKQNFIIDVSQFTNLKHLGIEYWKGIKNIGKLKNLESIVIIKYPYENLSEFLELEKLNILHIYSSKVKTLEGIEKLKNLKKISLARNNGLENINGIQYLKILEELEIEKCKNIKNYEIIQEIKTLKNLYVDGIKK